VWFNLFHTSDSFIIPFYGYSYWGGAFCFMHKWAAEGAIKVSWRWDQWRFCLFIALDLPPHGLLVFPNARMSWFRDRRQEQDQEYESLYTAQCSNTMERSVSYSGCFVGKLFIQCWLTPEL
jgi:hypothetical protein